MLTHRRIKKLSESVINKIAAGEVVQRPSNALKELLENSLDAKSTSISIYLKNAGLDELKIEDNGHGILVQDFPLLCERFATSKLSTFSDLSSIETFGFRGEALAAISFCAQSLTITSKTDERDTCCAFRAQFTNGKMLETQPTKVAGMKGTQILSRNMFYSMPLRMNAMKKRTKLEFGECMKVVASYAIHHPNVSFTLRKILDKSSHNLCSIKTNGGLSTTTKDVISLIYGREMAEYLIDIHLKHPNIDGICVHALISNSDFAVNVSKNQKKRRRCSSIPSSTLNHNRVQFILFVNHRLVECSIIRKCVCNVYEEYFSNVNYAQNKRSRVPYFVYLSIIIPSKFIDVNVHPTKKEVSFLYQESILSLIANGLNGKLQAENQVRTYTAYTLQHFMNKNENVDGGINIPLPACAKKAKQIRSFMKQTLNQTQKRIKSQKMERRENVKIDEKCNDDILLLDDQKSNVMKISKDLNRNSTENNLVLDETMVNIEEEKDENCNQTPSKSSNIVSIDLSQLSSIQKEKRRQKYKERRKRTNVRTDSGQSSLHFYWQPKNNQNPNSPLVSNARMKKSLVNRKSISTVSQPECILMLIENINRTHSSFLKKIFEENVFIGCVDCTDSTLVSHKKGTEVEEYVNNSHQRILFQSDTKLFLCNIFRISRVYFFELCLKNIGNFSSVLKLDDGLPNIYDLVLLGTKMPESQFSQELESGEMTAEEIAEKIAGFLCQPNIAQFMRKYFNVEIDIESKTIKTLPILIDGYIPPLLYLPLLVIRLVSNIQWFAEQMDDEEVEDNDDICMNVGLFRDISMEMARFYQIRPPQFYIRQECQNETQFVFGGYQERRKNENNLSWIIEHVIFRSMKKKNDSRKCAFNPPKFLVNDGSVVQIACTQQLYKVFERC